MEDKFEGTLPAAKASRLDTLFSTHFNGEAERLTDFIERNKRLHYLNCWCMNKHELVHMWKMYSKKNGVAISTTYSKLKRSIIPDHDIYSTKIKYINFSRSGKINIWNGVPLFFYKKSEYESEKEMRLVIRRSDENEKNDQPVIKCEVDLNILIRFIHISPFAPKWYTDVVKKVLGTFGLSNKEVHRNEL